MNKNSMVQTEKLQHWILKTHALQHHHRAYIQHSSIQRKLIMMVGLKFNTG